LGRVKRDWGPSGGILRNEKVYMEPISSRSPEKKGMADTEGGGIQGKKFPKKPSEPHTPPVILL